ncbi:MAG TPA: hypothetical protein IGS17_10045 [Oscillatoriales cyanobacterium M59_W2019_021]|nr:MAG: hypothetical protein D6728_09570 [Cyanobacteria bacterium J055]HIK29972.1 hypothetical protein [Oscillatoriales cyanobacterium M4454_W2019_049]HIK51247.1 hypothetical protein [Oscillatoriales cyanobacterium M59_W2019_021]
MNITEVKSLIQKALQETPVGYQPQAEDTNLESDLLMFYLLRQKSCSDRLQMAASMIRESRGLSLYCLRQRFGNLDRSQFARQVARAWLQEDCPDRFIPTGDEMTWIQDCIPLARTLHEILENSGISYYITGGVAAITYGEPRTTRDLDLVLSISPAEIDRLVAALEAAEFYVSGVEDAKSGRMRTLSITHMVSISRADLIIAGTEELDRLQFDRRVVLFVEGAGNLYFTSKEDVVLNKLKWRQRSHSDKQWRDVLGVLKVAGGDLDVEYLRKWADCLGMTDELSRALREAGLGSR